jgi:hypothetical protein
MQKKKKKITIYYFSFIITFSHQTQSNQKSFFNYKLFKKLCLSKKIIEKKLFLNFCKTRTSLNKSIETSITCALKLNKSLKTRTQCSKSKPIYKITYNFKPIKKKFFNLKGCESYKQYSDEYLACLARTLTHTIYHPIGTCKMGPASDPTSVVDPELRVLGGIKRLRVVDGSIIPKLITGNTNAPIIMIAEKSADIIKGVRLPPRSPPFGTYKPFDYSDYFNFIDRDER